MGAPRCSAGALQTQPLAWHRWLSVAVAAAAAAGMASSPAAPTTEAGAHMRCMHCMEWAQLPSWC